MQAISSAALLATLGSPLAFFAGAIEIGTMRTALLAATLCWFCSAPLWVGRRGRTP